MLSIITGIIISYFVGSIPTAYIFARIIKGVDIRTVGSGNVGATNASRLLGKKTGGLILVIDILKGLLPVVLIGNIVTSAFRTYPAFLDETLIRIVIGFASIAGHNWTIFLNFKGGKGVATTLGVLLGLAVTISGLRFVLCAVLATWILVFALTRIISVASIAASISLPVCMFLFNEPYRIVIAGIFISAFVIFRHKSNIKRLLEGKEPRFHSKKS